MVVSQLKKLRTPVLDYYMWADYWPTVDCSSETRYHPIDMNTNDSDINMMTEIAIKNGWIRDLDQEKLNVNSYGKWK
jgi:hypothetical protein